MPLYIPTLVFGDRRGSSGALGRQPGREHAASRSDVDLCAHLRAVGGRGRAEDIARMNSRTIHWYKYASPGNLYRLAGQLIPWFAVPAGILFVVGLYLGLFVAPTDFQQGDAYRVLFVHVPAAWMGMLLYVLLAFYAAVGWIFNARVSSMMASSLSITGAMFTFLALVTGSLWGRPTWGTWWVWDARTTSTLILLFLYIGFISLQSAIEDPQARRSSGRRAGARRSRQRADHLLLGAVVEHAAPGRDDPHRRRDKHGRLDAGAAADHDRRMLVVLHRRRAGSAAVPDSGTRAARSDQRWGRNELAGDSCPWVATDSTCGARTR